MKYKLVLGIEYKPYKKHADINVHLHDRCIDVFSLTDKHPALNSVRDKIDEKWYHHFDCYNRLMSQNYRMAWNDLPKPSLYKIYDLEEKDLKGSLTLEVMNPDSNYTNGFMSKSSLMRFPVIALIPEYLLEDDSKNLVRTMIDIDDGFGISLWRTKRPEVAEFWRLGWPCVNVFNVKRNDNKHEESGPKTFDWWLGGNFTIDLPIKTKFKTKFLSCNPNPDIGFPFTGTAKDLLISTYKPLLNTYKDENKRSNNT